MWRWGIICPALGPLFMPMLLSVAFMALWMGGTSLMRVFMSASETCGGSSSMYCMCSLGISNTCPSATGLMSRNARVCLSS